MRGWRQRCGGIWRSWRRHQGTATPTPATSPRSAAGWRLERLLNLVGSQLDRSDHAPFWNAGVPSVVVCDTALLRSRNYHRPTDTPDTLDYDALAAVTTATAAAAWQAGDLTGRTEDPTGSAQPLVEGGLS